MDQFCGKIYNWPPDIWPINLLGTGYPPGKITRYLVQPYYNVYVYKTK